MTAVTSRVFTIVQEQATRLQLLVPSLLQLGLVDCAVLVSASGVSAVDQPMLSGNASVSDAVGG
jgi:hypothetical protein